MKAKVITHFINSFSMLTGLLSVVIQGLFLSVQKWDSNDDENSLNA